MESQNDKRLQDLKIVSSILICIGTVVVLTLLRIASHWIVRRFLLLESTTRDDHSLSSVLFIRNLCEIPILSWLYPIGTAVSLIFLTSPDVKYSPMLGWEEWTDWITCVHIGHLFTQMIGSTVIWTGRIRLNFRVDFLHYTTAFVMNIICITNQQMSVLVLVGIVAQLPLLFATVNTITSKSVCPCLWISTWVLWLLSLLACTFTVPGIFLIKPLITKGISAALSTSSVVTLFWAISYFGIMFLWELHKPFRSLVKECGNDHGHLDDQDTSRVPIFYTEASPLLTEDRMTEAKNQHAIP